MIISVSALTWIVGVALGVTVLAPLLLLVLWIKDASKGELW